MDKIFSQNRDETERWWRDLRWVVDSPFLMATDFSEQVGYFLTEGELGAEVDVRRADGVTEKYEGRRVGYYFENLVHFWLKQVRGLEVLAQGMQVEREGRTVGELDFVFRDEQNKVLHWEVAAKFYLYHPDDKVKGSHYIGPNAQDTFELKRDKIFAKQLPLSKTAFPAVDCRQAFVKGRIFYHPQTVVPDKLPPGLMDGHLRGRWIRCSELSWLEGGVGTKKVSYHLIEKPHWLSDFHASMYEKSLLDFQSIKEHLQSHFSEQNQAVLISVLTWRDDCWQECERVFVVADDWPAT